LSVAGGQENAITYCRLSFAYLGAPLKGTRRAGIEKKVLKRILCVQRSFGWPSASWFDAGKHLVFVMPSNREDHARRRAVRIEFSVRPVQTAFGSRDLSAGMDDLAFGAHRTGVFR